jgi:hypothetical protein
MALKLSKREVAERILDVLVKDLGLKPGERVPDHQLKEKYRAGGGDAGDIGIGLEYADTNEWLSYNAATEAWYLTEQGHEYAL